MPSKKKKKKIGHKPYGWWYAPKHKPTRNGYLIGYKESINYAQQVLDKQVNNEK